MKIYLHPHDRDGLPVEVVLSPTEAEEWVGHLQAAARRVREGHGDELRLLGQPARIVVTVRETSSLLNGERTAGIVPPGVEPVRLFEWLMAIARAGLTVTLAIVALVVCLSIAFRLFP